MCDREAQTGQTFKEKIQKIETIDHFSKLARGFTWESSEDVHILWKWSFKNQAKLSVDATELKTVIGLTGSLKTILEAAVILCTSPSSFYDAVGTLDVSRHLMNLLADCHKVQAQDLSIQLAHFDVQSRKILKSLRSERNEAAEGMSNSLLMLCASGINIRIYFNFFVIRITLISLFCN